MAEKNYQKIIDIFTPQQHGGFRQKEAGAIAKGAAAAKAKADPASANTNAGQQQQTAASGEQPLIDPLSVQLFFANTIAPYLDKISGNMKGEADQYGSMMHSLLSGGAQLPSQYRGVLQAEVPQQQTGMKMLADAMAGSALAGPALDELMKSINQAKNTQYKAYLESLKQQTLGGGSGTDLASIMQLFGVTPGAAAGGTGATGG